MKLRDILKLTNEAFQKDISKNFKAGWIGTFVIRKKDNKRFVVTSAKHYGNETELTLDNGIILTDRYKPWYVDNDGNRYDPD